MLKNNAARVDATAHRPMRVLVVDDEEAVRRFIDRVLRQAGYVTMVAADGAEAVDLAARKPAPDILVTDVLMPGMRGEELARRLRHDEPSLKVLYLTGFSDQLFKEKLALWQDEAFLEKPCSVQGLLQAVALLASGRLGVDLPPAS